ncbi:MAG: hypothetical protein JWN71_3156 [Xanthobacteraceae bacterium]|jgi:hypothetical protein|nr:hypothetical protein [Xanthobacteraceae bacterium]
MTIVNSSLPATPKSRDSESLILLTAIGLSLAVTLGVSFSSAATGALQSAFDAFGIQQTAKANAELDLQGGAIIEINQALRSVKSQVAMLNANDGGELGVVAEHRFARLDADVSALTAKIEALSAARDAVANTGLNGQVAGLETGLTMAGLEIGALRSSLEGRDDKRGKEIAAIATRLDRLETIVHGREVTGSIKRPLRKRVRHVARAPKVSAPESFMMIDGVVRR